MVVSRRIGRGAGAQGYRSEIRNSGHVRPCVAASTVIKRNLVGYILELRSGFNGLPLDIGQRAACASSQVRR